MQYEQLILNVPLFASLPVEVRQGLVASLRERRVPSETLLIKEGEAGDRFSIIVEGQVEIIKAQGTADERQLGLRGPGDFLGEMSLLDPTGLRTASVRSRTPVVLVELTSGDFDMLIHKHADLAVKILREVANRLRRSEDDTIRDLRAKNRQLAEAYRELQEAQAQLIEKEKLEHELRVARQIQESILPPTPEPLGLCQFGARMQPARAVGGDLYDFIRLGETKVGIAIGDVSDKGVPAALFMALFSSLLRAEARRTRSPEEVLRRVNQELLERNTTGTFVTAIYGVMDCQTGRFSYARGGHELPLLSDPAGGVSTPPMGKGQPLCLFPRPLLDVGELEVHPGHRMLMYTDGAVDAVDVHHARFGLEGLLATLKGQPTTTAQEMCDRVVAAVSSHQGAITQFDDLTLVAVLRGP